MTQPDQRHSSRSPIARPIDVLDIESGIGFRASAVDVSDGGLAFHAPMEPALGADMYVTLDGSGAQAPFKVVRIQPTDQGFTVAGTTR